MRILDCFGHSFCGQEIRAEGPFVRFVPIKEAPPMPVEADIKQGGEYWAVHFASADSKPPLLVDAVTLSRVLGYETSERDINCDLTDPAPSLVEEKMVVSAYFATQAQADQVAAEYAKVAGKGGAPRYGANERTLGAGPWVGKVKTMCMD
jgi:hypothetical protein